MTTGKPQQVPAPSSPHDDLIAELSKLMAQDAQASRPQPVAAPAAESPVTPFAVRIPGVTSAPQAEVAPQVPRFDFGRPPEPVDAAPRQEPAFAPAPAEPAPPFVAPSTDEPAPFNFDFNFGQPRQQQPEPQPAPAPIAAVASASDHDAIADLIAAELMGDLTPPTPLAAAPAAEPIPALAEMPAPEPVAVEPEPAPEPEPSVETAPAATWAPTPVSLAAADRPAQARPALRPVNLTPLHKVEKPAGDNFRIAPVFGLGTTPPPVAAPAVAPAAKAPEQPRAEHGYLSPVTRQEPELAAPANDAPAPNASGDLDPIDEIESLIGRAVRVELDNAREQRPLASPALRSLATPTMPPQIQPVTGVDEAILAAAAATGAEIGWVEPAAAREDVAEPRGQRAPRRAGMLRAIIGPLVAVALLLAAGFGLYTVLGLGGTDGPPPVLTADATPIKQVPATQNPVEQLQQSIVFNEMDGVVPGAEEQLVSRDQADVNEVTAIPPAAAVSDEGLANRKVRTVTVRPDGSIVSGGDESVAGAAILPVVRPNVPAVPGAAGPSDSLLASAAAMEPTPAPVATPAPEPVAVVEPLVPGTEIAVVDAAGAPIAGKTAPVPYVRPASVGDAPATGPTAVTAIINTAIEANSGAEGSLPPPPSRSELQPLAAAAPAAAPAQPEDVVARLTGETETAPPQQQPAATAQASAPSSEIAPAYVQLSSQRSEAAANQVANEMATRYSSILNGATLEVNRVDLGARGIYFRVRIPAVSTSAANQLCSSVKANGGDCFIM